MTEMRYGAPRHIQDLAAGYANAQAVSGARKATGSILFSGNLVADDVVTVGGVDFVAGDDFAVGGSLSATLTTLVTLLNASVHAEVSKATYGQTSSTTLTVSYDQNGPEGDDFEIDASVGTVTAMSGGAAADVLNLKANSVFLISTAAGTAQSLVLPAGLKVGQRITLVLVVKGTGSNAVIAGTFKGGTSLTFDTAEEFADLLWIGDKWLPLVNTGAVA